MYGLALEGGRAFRRELKRAGINLKDLGVLNRKAAGIVAAAGSATAPRRSGNLAKSLRASGGARTGKVTAKLPYANPVHWGWPKRGIKRNPWLARAAKSTEPRWLSLYTAELEKILKQLETTP